MNINNILKTTQDGKRRLTVKDVSDAIENGTAENDPEIQQELINLPAGLSSIVASAFRPPKIEIPKPILIPRPLTSREMAELLERERIASRPMNVWVKVGIVAGVIATIVSIAALIISIMAYLATLKPSV